ncbi:MAG: hypothetical protein RBU30_11785 [Polyangia bacterium]|jgi:hypothetical protein|nr:hypothetical protein [Polyangia bacterium]
MLPLGILLLLYSLASWLWPLLGKQLVLLLWLQGLPSWGQWLVRGILLAAGLGLVVAARLRKRR